MCLAKMHRMNKRRKKFTVLFFFNVHFDRYEPRGPAKKTEQSTNFRMRCMHD